MAGALLRGNPVTIALKGADWREVTLPNPNAYRHNVDRLGAELNFLPQKHASQSVVITQYLLDAVSDPFRLFLEISRVLSLGGIWINFSLPFRIPGERVGFGRADQREFIEAATERGLANILFRRERFRPIDSSQLSGDAMSTEQSVQYAVFRRTEQQLLTEKSYRPAEDAPDWWQQTPVPVVGRGAHLSRGTMLFSQAESCEFSTSGMVSSMSFGLENNDQVAFVTALFQFVRGRLPHDEILRSLLKAGWQLSSAEYRELMFYMSSRDGLFADTHLTGLTGNVWSNWN